MTSLDDIAQTSQQGLVTKVTNYLREHIVMDHFQPGQRLPERTLAEELQVSRTPLREALKILAAEGLVEILPNRGAVVSDVSPLDVKEKAYVLSVLEQAAAELVCEKATDRDITELQALHYEMKAAFIRGDRQNYFRINQEIHDRIVVLSGNRSLREMHGYLCRQLYRVRYLSNEKSEKWTTAMAEHEAIMAALEARDATRMGQELRNHLGKTWFKFAANENPDAQPSGQADAKPAKQTKESPPADEQ